MGYELGSSFKFVFKGSRGYRTFMKQANLDKLIKKHPEVEHRLKVINFLSKYNIKTTVDAFEKSRSTIYLWRQKFNKLGIHG